MSDEFSDAVETVVQFCFGATGQFAFGRVIDEREVVGDDVVGAALANLRELSGGIRALT